jgi:VanZ family protein
VSYGLFYWLTPSLQNALHIPAYGALAFSWQWALRAWPCTAKQAAIAACVIASGYGAFDEYHQVFVPQRYASLSDVVLNVAGALLGVWAFSRTVAGSTMD